MAKEKATKTIKADTKKKSVEDVDFDDVEGTVAETKPKAKAKAVKEEKPKKTKRVVEVVEDDPVPKELGPRWPFKRGSTMRYVWTQMYNGCNAKALEKEIEESGHSWKLMLGVMRVNNQRTPTHTWKLNEEGGRLKITDVKYIGPKTEKPVKVSKKAKAEETDDNE